MFTRYMLLFALSAAIPMWAQVEPSATGGEVDLGDDHMMTPPPVSGVPYPVAGSAESPSNDLSLGVDFTAAYIDNVFSGGYLTPVANETYTILPHLRLTQVLPRHRRSFSYQGGFTFYNPTSVLNQGIQNIEVGYQYRWTPRTTLSIQDRFVQASNAFAASSAQVPIPGSPGNYDVVTPFSSRLTNDVTAGVTYQFALNSMVGATGGSSLLTFPNPSQSIGLNDSKTESATGFYSERLTPQHYVGVVYEFRHYTTSPVESTTDTSTYSGFYTHYFKPNFSISVQAGAERYETSGPTIGTVSSWNPQVSTNMGWQGRHNSFSAQFARTISSGGGLLGSYKVISGGANYAQQMNRFWSFDATANYIDTHAEQAIADIYASTGHSLTASAGVRRLLSQRFMLRVGYDRIQSHYNNVVSLSGNPNADRVYATISYNFSRPIGH